MKKLLIYIFISLHILILHSCSSKELLEPNPTISNRGPITFTARPSGYVETKEIPNPSEFNESAVHNAFFLLFDLNGILRVKDSAYDQDGNVIYSIGFDFFDTLSEEELSNTTVCFLANCPLEFITDELTIGQTTLDNFKSDYLSINYAQNADAIGVPSLDLDDNEETDPVKCLPMFCFKSGISIKYYTGNPVFELERLFAKIEINLSISDNIKSLTLNHYRVNNMPKYVTIFPKNAPTTWASGNSTDFSSDNVTKSTFSLPTGTLNSLTTGSSAKTIIFYVPEHKIGSLTNDEADDKADYVIGTNYKPTYVSITCNLVDNGDIEYLATYDIYLGNKSENNFDINRNTKYINNVRIKGVSNTDYDNRVDLETLTDIKEISEGEVANCYIIVQDGTYIIPAYKGAHKVLDDTYLCGEGYDDVIACDNSNINIEIDRNRSNASMIFFTISGLRINVTNIQRANAVIARYTDDTKQNMIWSWHLWISPGLFSTSNLGVGDMNLNEIDYGGVADETLPDGTTTMLNMNLGAVPAGDLDKLSPKGTYTGVYYKYGHSAPYFTSVKYAQGSDYYGISSGLTSSSTSDPTWDYSSTYFVEEDGKIVEKNNYKSPDDPCPPGYRVPEEAYWSTSNEANATKTHSSLYDAFDFWNRGDNAIDLFASNDIYYPYSGYVDGAGGLVPGSTSGSDEQSTQLNQTVKIPSNQDVTAPLGNYIKTEPADPPVKYTDINYKKVDESREGYLRTDNSSIKISYNEKGFEITSCKITTGVWSKQTYKGWFSTYTYYIADYTGKNTQNVDIEDLKLNNKEHYDDIVDAVVDANSSWIGNIVGNIKDWISPPTADFDYISIDKDYGYQVRCVKE